MTFTFKALPRQTDEGVEEHPDDFGIDLLRVVYKDRAYMSDLGYQRLGGKDGKPSADFQVILDGNSSPAFLSEAPANVKMEILNAHDNMKLVKVQAIGPGNQQRAASMFDSSTIYSDGTPVVTIYHEGYNALYCWPVASDKNISSVTIRKNDLSSIDIHSQ